MPVLSKKPTGQGAEMGNEVGMSETGMKEMTGSAVPARQKQGDSSLLPPPEPEAGNLPHPGGGVGSKSHMGGSGPAPSPASGLLTLTFSRSVLVSNIVSPY